MWNNIKNLPEIGNEVLVWVDGHRGPAWGNSYALVAYLNYDGHFYEERHHENGPLAGVIFWKYIEKPNRCV